MSAKISLAKRDDHSEPKAARPAPAAESAAPGAAQATGGKADGLTLIIARNAFYAASSKTMLKVFLGQLVLIAVMVGVIVKLLDFTDSQDHFFPVQADNTLILERPLSEPVYSNDQIRSWVENAVTHTMTFGFYDHLMRLQQSRMFFTTQGWASFTKALDEAQIFKRIGANSESSPMQNKQVVVARLRSGDRATIVDSGRLHGSYTWKVDLNIDILFNTATTQARFTWKVHTTVTRLPAMESREGIGISQLIAEAAGIE